MSNDPTLSPRVLMAAVDQLKRRADAVGNDLEVLATRVRYLAQHVEVIAEQMTVMLGAQPPCPDQRFPELNHHEEE